MKDRRARISESLSLVLRHRPERVGITPGREGWVFVRSLLEALESHVRRHPPGELREVARPNGQQRFSLGPDGPSMRADQGHSVGVEIGYGPVEPPAVLYHRTAERSIPSIREHGLLSGRGHRVRPSEPTATAVAVGRRHGTPVVLRVARGAMHEDGRAFFRSTDGVRPTAHAPARYITLGDGAPR